MQSFTPSDSRKIVDSDGYLSTLLKGRKKSLEQTLQKLDKIHTELEASGYIAPEEINYPPALEKEVVKILPTEEPKKESVQLKGEIIEREINNKKINKLNVIQLQITQLERELKRAQQIEAEITPLKSEIDQYRLQNEKLLEKLHKKDHTIKSLNEQIKVMAELEQLLTKMRYQLKQTEQEAFTFKGIATKTEEQLKETEKNRDTLKENLTQLNVQSLELQSKLQESHNSLNKLQSRITTELTPEIQKYKERIEAQEIKLKVAEDLEKNIEQLSEMLNDIRGENSKLREQVVAERDSKAEGRLETKAVFNQYKSAYAELLGLIVDGLHLGKFTPLSNSKVEEELYQLAIELLFEEKDNLQISQKELKAALNCIEGDLLLKILNRLEKLGQIKIPTFITTYKKDRFL